MTRKLSSYWQAKSSEEITLSAIILDVLSDHGLSGWAVIFSRESNRLGYCDYLHKEICISRKVILSSWKEAMDTAMHEVAHAIAGSEAKHGAHWKEVAEKLGARPEAKAENYVNLHQVGETKLINTNYGPVKIVVGEIAEVYSTIGNLRILEVERKRFTGETAQGVRYSLSIDYLHPNSGDPSKVISKVVFVKDYLNRDVKIVLGKTAYLKNGNIPYVAVEARRRRVLTIGPSGDRLLIPAEFFKEV